MNEQFEMRHVFHFYSNFMYSSLFIHNKGNDNIGASGAQSLADSLKSNSTLTTLNLECMIY